MRFSIHERISARRVARALFRQQRKMAATLALALGLGGGWAAGHPPLWRAEAVVAITGGGPEAAARLFGRRVAVRSEAGSGLVRLTLDGADGAAAAAALAGVIEAARSTLAHPVAAEPAAAIRDRQEAFRALMARRAQAEAEATGADAEASVLADKLALLAERVAKSPATIQLSSASERSKVLEEARSKLFQLQTREQELLGKYQRSSPLVEAVEDERRQVEQTVHRFEAMSESRVESGVNPLRQQAEQEQLRAETAQAAARAKGRAMARQLTEIDRQLGVLAGNDKDLPGLERALAEADARQAGASAVTAIAVVERAEAAARAMGPSWAETLGLAAAAGLLAALLVAALGERWSTTFAEPAEVERRLGLAVLTTVSREG